MSGSGVDLKSWLASKRLSKLSSLLNENDIEEISDFSALKTKEDIEKFANDLQLKIIQKNKFIEAVIDLNGIKIKKKSKPKRKSRKSKPKRKPQSKLQPRSYSDSDAEESVVCLLNKMKLSQYISSFMDEGHEDIDVWQELTMVELRNDLQMKSGHAKRFIKHLKKQKTMILTPKPEQKSKNQIIPSSGIVHILLKQWNLGQYITNFLEEGYEDIEDWQELTLDHLQNELNMKRNHAKRFIKQCRALIGFESDTDSPPSDSYERNIKIKRKDRSKNKKQQKHKSRQKKNIKYKSSTEEEESMSNKEIEPFVSLLNKWGLDQYITNFRVEGYTDIDIWHELSADDLKKEFNMRGGYIRTFMKKVRLMQISNEVRNQCPTSEIKKDKKQQQLNINSSFNKTKMSTFSSETKENLPNASSNTNKMESNSNSIPVSSSVTTKSNSNTVSEDIKEDDRSKISSFSPPTKKRKILSNSNSNSSKNNSKKPNYNNYSGYRKIKNETQAEIVERRRNGYFTPTSEDCATDHNFAYDKIYEYENESDDDQNMIRPSKYIERSEAIDCPPLQASKPIIIKAFNKYKYYQFWLTSNNFAKNVAAKFRHIYINEQYDEESMMEDMEDLEDSVILSELLDIYEWNNEQQQMFVDIIMHLQPILEIYEEWHALFKHMTTNDFACYPCHPEKQPCKHTMRMWVLMKFYHHWLETVLRCRSKVMNRFHLTVSEFVDSLPHYDQTWLQSDFQHLQEFHLCKKHFKRLLPIPYVRLKWMVKPGLTVKNVQNETQKNMKGGKAYLTIFEYFETTIADCNAFECPSFERLYRSRYDENYDEIKLKLHAIPKNWKKVSEKEKKRIRTEVNVQKTCDSIHNFIWHTSAKYSSMGMGESDEHRQLILLIASNRNKKWSYNVLET